MSTTGIAAQDNHLREARRLVDVANGCDWQDVDPLPGLCIAAAQVEATLALGCAVRDLVTATEIGRNR